jgi:hypothetical protein
LLGWECGGLGGILQREGTIGGRGGGGGGGGVGEICVVGGGWGGGKLIRGWDQKQLLGWEKVGNIIIYLLFCTLNY